MMERNARKRSGAMQPQIPPEFLQAFTGENLDAAAARGAILASVDEEGWPHQAYLSAGEILAHPAGLSIALWPGSRTTANIGRHGRAVLYAAAEGCIWEARLQLGRRQIAGEGPAIFDGEVVETRRHAAPYAEVVSLLDFRLLDRQDTLKRWATQIALLRGA
jgi:hypothetical protein